MIIEQFAAGGGSGGAGSYGGIVAWIVFNGTGTPSITASSSNISSITDNGVGDYTVNFSPSLPDANYALAGLGSGNAYKDVVVIHAASEGAPPTTKTASACRLVVGRTEGTNTDSNIVSVIFVK